MDQKCRVGDFTAVCTLGHLLNHCKHSLDRFRFRHDSCLSYLVKRIVANKADTMKVYADLEGWKINLHWGPCTTEHYSIVYTYVLCNIIHSPLYRIIQHFTVYTTALNSCVEIYKVVQRSHIGAKLNLYCGAIELVCDGSPKVCVLVERKALDRVKSEL